MRQSRPGGGGRHFLAAAGAGGGKNAAEFVDQRALDPQSAGLIEEGSHLARHIAKARGHTKQDGVVIGQLGRAGDFGSLIDLAARNTTNELITQQVVLTEQSHKRDLLSYIIRESGWNQVLVFCRTKHGSNRLADKLARDGLTAEALHGNKSQAARTRALAGFKSGKVVVLVATDIAARGLDIDQLPYVVNFELPNVPEDYVHRIGRTGRAGSEGVALSLVDRSEMRLLKQIERLTRNNVERIAIDGWTPPSAEALSAQAAADREAHRLAEAAAPKQRSARPMRGHKDNRGGQADTF